MMRPTQTIHILDGETKYTFDSVIKAEHTHTMTMLEDEKELNKQKNINYAVRKPSKILLEVSVTDTVSVTNDPLTVGASTRSGSAYANLHAMLYERDLLTIITRMHTFTKMVMTDFIITEDPDHQYEMYANVGFTEAYLQEKPDKKKKTTPKADAEKPVEIPGSVWFESTKTQETVAKIGNTVKGFFQSVLGGKKK